MPKDFAIITNMFGRNTSIFEKTVQGIHDAQWLVQPGEDSNHLMWIAGHVVVHRAIVPKVLGMEWSAPWQRLFARGARRVATEQYPPAAEIQGAWKEVSEKLTTALENAGEDALSQPAAQGMPSLDGTVGGTISFFCLHEIYHVGQMGYLRKWLGYGQVVG
jgi:uncharacterized damage-inducible protein DinB